MDSREILAARVSVESSMNGNTVDARPMPNQDTLQLKGSPGLSLQNHDDRSRAYRPPRRLGCCRLKDCGPTWRYGWWSAMSCGYRAMK